MTIFALLTWTSFRNRFIRIERVKRAGGNDWEPGIQLFWVWVMEGLTTSNGVSVVYLFLHPILPGLVSFFRYFLCCLDLFVLCTLLLPRYKTALLSSSLFSSVSQCNSCTAYIEGEMLAVTKNSTSRGCVMIISWPHRTPICHSDALTTSISPSM